MRPSVFHAPGLDKKTDTVIKNILRRWAAQSDGTISKAKSKKRK